MLQILDMKKTGLFLFLMALNISLILGQEQDEVMYAMYRYHPQEAIKNLGIDSLFIQTETKDTSYISQIIVYDTMGRELKFIDLEGEYEYRMDYYPKTGLLQSSRLFDFDSSPGPVDSFAYNKKGKMVRSYYGLNGIYDTRYYKYKRGKMKKETFEHYSYTYTYKKGKRKTYTSKSNNGKKLNSKKIYQYDSAGNLSEIIEQVDGPWINFQLFYNSKNLLTLMKVFKNTGELSQQYQTVYLDNSLINFRLWHINIKNNDLSKAEYKNLIYTYSYRN